MVDVLALGVLLPDDAAFDPIAWATGAEDFCKGKTWADLNLNARKETLVWRKSYCFGYLAAMRVRTVR